MVKIIYQKDTNTFEKIPSYIYQRSNGRFEIRKRIGGILMYWGSFTTLEEARLYRAYYIGKNWVVNPHFINHEKRYICEQGGRFIIQKRINGKIEYFGTFKNLEDAQDERDICIACNWDLEAIVEFGDSIEV